MTYLLLALFLPFIGAFGIFALNRYDHRTRGFFSTAIAISSLLLVLFGSRPIISGDALHVTYKWFPTLGVNLEFYADSLSMMFAVLISGIGTLVCIYAIGYLHDDRIDTFFWFSLLLFMGSMLGVVLAGDLILLLVFWELTSISSFLLIGIEYWNFESRRGALNALFVTAAGGLFLLAGLLLISVETDTFSLVKILHGHSLHVSPLVTSALLLILIGAFTKSAHFPFHFWLPQAMAAPTPVSAYLHSATMVKAGIYLIIRLNPVFSFHPYWQPIIMFMGLTTFAIGGILAISQEDMKALLAYSTISQLGMITFMIGIGTKAAMVGAIFHILAHATFKGALFMGAGAIDHTLGTRRLDQIGFLGKSMPLIAWVMGLSAFSMAGIIPFSGFVSKEAMFKGITKMHIPSANWILASAVVASILTFLYSMRFVIELPFQSARTEFSGGPDHSPHGLDKWCLQLPPTILCSGTILLGIGLLQLLGPLPTWINASVNAVAHSMGHHLHFHFALWHGINLPLAMTGIVIASGLLFYWLLPAMRGFWHYLAEIPGPETINRIFHDNIIDVTHDILDVFILGPLNKYLRIFITFVLGITIFAWVQTVPDIGPVNLLPAIQVTYLWIPFLLVMFGSLAILGLDDPVPAVIALGVFGFLVSMVFLVYKAPDLILTQIAVETVSIVIFLWVLKDIDFSGDRERSFRGWDFTLALFTSCSVAYVLLTVLETKQELSGLALYYIENSVPEAWGHNMVNVILVDFRALDTLGEISVLGIATVGILALMGVTFRSTREGTEP